VTRVCLLGSPDITLRYELLSRETSREALATYDLERPFVNALAVETVSLGAAVSLLNDLSWYLSRFVEEALVYEPSVSESEWLSRELATAVRDGAIDPDGTGEYLKIYGLEPIGDDGGSRDGPGDGDGTTAGGRAEPGGGDGTAVGGRAEPGGGDGTAAGGIAEPGDGPASTAIDPNGPTRRPVDPLFVRRTDGEVPSYDLRDVPETLVVRLTEGEFTP